MRPSVVTTSSVLKELFKVETTSVVMCRVVGIIFCSTRIAVTISITLTIILTIISIVLVVKHCIQTIQVTPVTVHIDGPVFHNILILVRRIIATHALSTHTATAAGIVIIFTRRVVQKFPINGIGIELQ